MLAEGEDDLDTFMAERIEEVDRRTLLMQFVNRSWEVAVPSNLTVENLGGRQNVTEGGMGIFVTLAAVQLDGRRTSMARG